MCATRAASHAAPPFPLHHSVPFCRCWPGCMGLHVHTAHHVCLPMVHVGHRVVLRLQARHMPAAPRQSSAMKVGCGAHEGVHPCYLWFHITTMPCPHAPQDHGQHSNCMAGCILQRHCSCCQKRCAPPAAALWRTLVLRAPTPQHQPGGADSHTTDH